MNFSDKKIQEQLDAMFTGIIPEYKETFIIFINSFGPTFMENMSISTLTVIAAAFKSGFIAGTAQSVVTLENMFQDLKPIELIATDDYDETFNQDIEDSKEKPIMGFIQTELPS